MGKGKHHAVASEAAVCNPGMPFVVLSSSGCSALSAAPCSCAWEGGDATIAWVYPLCRRPKWSFFLPGCYSSLGSKQWMVAFLSLSLHVNFSQCHSVFSNTR